VLSDEQKGEELINKLTKNNNKLFEIKDLAFRSFVSVVCKL
jgi:hypothetical protein